LLGRKTYDGFAAAWPKMEGTGDFGVKMNSMPKYVVSSTLRDPKWSGAKVVTGDVVAEVRKLKALPGNDLLLSGSGQLFRALMGTELIDLYRFMLHPIVVGSGKRLFTDGVGENVLQLSETKRFSSGIVILEYLQAKHS
jgi:dihydrofolate reductase